jgi:hypothetical protein
MLVAIVCARQRRATCRGTYCRTDGVRRSPQSHAWVGLTLINRMTGHNESQARERPQPPSSPAAKGVCSDVAIDADQERIEIPAFCVMKQTDFVV